MNRVILITILLISIGLVSCRPITRLSSSNSNNTLINKDLTAHPAYDPETGKLKIELPNMNGGSVTSVTANIFDNTGQNMNLFGAQPCLFAYGAFQQSPPSEIAAHSANNQFVAISNGLGTVQGACTYSVGQSLCTLSFKNPLVGSNAYSFTCTANSGYTASYTGGSGYHAKVTYTVSQLGKN